MVEQERWKYNVWYSRTGGSIMCGTAGQGTCGSVMCGKAGQATGGSILCGTAGKVAV